MDNSIDKVLKLSFKAVLPVIIALALMSCSGGSYVRTEAGNGQKNDALDEELLFQLLAAEIAGNVGDFDTAVQYYQQALDGSNDTRISARATYIALYSKDFDAALASLSKWSQFTPDDPELVKLYAVTYLRADLPEKAIPYIVQAMSHEDDDRKNAVQIKNLLDKESSVVGGLVVLKALTDIYGDNIQLLLLHARYAAQLEKYDSAIVILDRIVNVDPTLSEVHIIKAKILSAQGKKKESIALLKSILEEQPENDTLRMQYARLMVESRNYEEARKQFLILLTVNENDAEILLSLALLSIETDHVEEATEYLTQLVELDKNTNVANYYLGRIEQGKHKWKNAISHYLKVVSGEYEFDAKIRTAVLFTRFGRIDEGLMKLEVLASQQSAWPNRVRAYLAQGEILHDEKRYKEAMEMYSRALQQNPDDPDLLYARALVAEKIDRIDITESDLLKVLSNEPENVNALNALGYTLADRTTRLQEALRYIQKAAELVPDDPAILDSLGWVSYRLGNMQDALMWLGKAFELLQDPEIAAHYGEVLWKIEQKTKAKEVWEMGQKEDANHPILLETLRRFKQ